MGRSVTSVLNEPDEILTALGAEGGASLVITGRGRLQLRLTRVALQFLRLSSVEERLSRIAFIEVPRELALVSFPIGSSTSQVWAGIRAQANELVAVRPGQRLHARTDGPSHWGSVWFPQETFVRYRRALAGDNPELPAVVSIWHPSASAGRRLRFLHSAAMRAALGHWETLADADAAHGLEQQLVHALIECLAGEPARVGTAATRRQQDHLACFEDLLRGLPEGDVTMADITAALGISGRSLRKSCQLQLGLSPMTYLRLHRMQSVHRILRSGTSGTLSVSDVARRFGFRSPGRFAGMYHDLFGELPSSTLRRGTPRRTSTANKQRNVT